ncbi:HAD hydrolase-like protein [bacterium]|nr:HAD hydrolase-like protein [bacterium]NCT20787.1 HAD hydrolase-like protein [bacterium]OIO84137.1 MAG: hypothetical protein AUK01_10240 [Anaerolineae bacterium CG2_30_57_67]
MTFTLLLDLDDTLLDSNIEAFISAYFQKLAAHLAGRIPPEKLLTELAASTRRMYASVRLDQTLEQVFSARFYPPLGLTQPDLAADLDDFYDNVFPSLQPLTRPRPDAVALVEWAFAQGWRIAIATDPLFPRKAILHRLRWAGLPPEKYPFALISDFQTFHFAKASVAYYAEFLNALGWENDPVLMVGDSLERDILPARKAGLPVFWLAPADGASAPGGSLADLRHYFQTVDLNSLKVDFSAPEALIPLLMGNAAALHSLSRQLDSAQWAERPASGEWALTEIFCHLRDVELEVNLPRIAAVLREENAFIAGQVTDPWAEERDYLHQDGAAALDAYLAARLRLLETLRALTPAQWERSARHTIFGPTHLRELVAFFAEHDRVHVQQARQVTAMAGNANHE